MERKGGLGSSQQSSGFSNAQGFPVNTNSSSFNSVFGTPAGFAMSGSGATPFGSAAGPSFSSITNSASSDTMHSTASAFGTLVSQTANACPPNSAADATGPFMFSDVNRSTTTFSVTGSGSRSGNTVFGTASGGSGFGFGSSGAVSGSGFGVRSSNTGSTFVTSGSGFGLGVNSSGSEFRMNSTGLGSGTTVGGSRFGFSTGMEQGGVSGAPASFGFGSGSSGKDTTFGSSGMRSAGPVIVSEMQETHAGSGVGGIVSGSSVFGTGTSEARLSGSQPFSTGFGTRSSGTESASQSSERKFTFGSGNLASGIGQGSTGSLNRPGLGSSGFTFNSPFGGGSSTGFGNLNTGDKSVSSATVTSTNTGVLTVTGVNSGTSGSAFGTKTSAGLFGATTNSVKSELSEAPTSVFGGTKSFSTGIPGKESFEQKTSFGVVSQGHTGISDKVNHSQKPSIAGTTSPSGEANRTRGYTADITAKEEQLKEEKPGVSLFGGRFISSTSSTSPSIFGGKRESESYSVPRERGEPKFTFSLQSGSNEKASHAAGPSGHKRGADGEEQADVIVKRGKLTQPETKDQQQLGQDAKLHSSGSGTPGRRSTRHSSSHLEQIGSKTCIMCKHVPAKYNKHSILHSHFSKFGEVVKLRLVPAKMSATIHFRTHEEAVNAKTNGQLISPNEQPLLILWRNTQSDKSPGDQQETKQRYSLRKESSQPSSSFTGEDSRQKVVRKSQPLSATVADELESMAGSDSSMGDLDYNVFTRPSEKRSQVSSASSQGNLNRHSPPPAPNKAASSLLKQTQFSNVESALSTLRKATASTTMEKISMLEARDKLLRQARSSKAGSSIHSQAFVGTCADMCPEKERLYREEVRRLSIYEIIPGSSTHAGSTSLVDHSKAVKEYSRSSADQEEPLPHELRPLPVLVMTMTYLLKEIAELGEDGKWAEWYDFLWNRTRGIRKDITQQQLCSREVAGLIEKCTRFHIYCSERLCEEDMMVFDPKINNENLTKCLQTLQEIYADLENKHIFCPTEPEFRAYMILMKLNEGDTLRQIQQLRPSVRNSPEVEFAVKAYSALNSNNYIRFFRLVKCASFLNACILHRYFSQVRARALQIMLRAHGSGPRQRVLFPVSELKRLLAFESESQVREFCENYGVATEGPDVVLDRAGYVEPESSLPAWRAKDLVESKCMVSVGQVISGELLPTVFHLPTPHSSFDSQGRFIGSLEDIPQVQMQAVMTSAEQQQLDTQQLLKTFQPSLSGEGAGEARVPSAEAVKLVARDLFLEVIGEMVEDVSRSLFEDIQCLLSLRTPIMEEIVTETTRQLAGQVCEEMLRAECVRQQKVAEEEDRDRRERTTREATDSLLSGMLKDEIVLVAETYLTEARARERAEQEQQCVSQIATELLTEVAGELTSEVVDDVYAVDVVQRLQLLSDLQRVVELKRQTQFLWLWRQEYAKRQRQKRAMLEFPSAPSMLPTQSILQGLMPDRPSHVSPFLPNKDGFLANSGRNHLAVASPLEHERQSLTFTAHLSLACLLRNLQRTRTWQPLRLSSLLKEPLTSCVKQWPKASLLGGHVYWKLLLLLPDEDDQREKPGRQTEVVTTLSQWLRAKFSYGDKQHLQTSGQGILSLYRVALATSSDSCPKSLSVSICVRVPSQSPADDGTQSTSCDLKAVVKGTSAIMCLVPHKDTTDDAVWKACGRRLDQLLKAKPMVPPVPLVLLLPCTAAEMPAVTVSTAQQLAARLGVEGLLEQGLVSQVAVADLPIKPEHPISEAVTLPVLHSQLTEAVCWLAAQTPEPPRLKSAPLWELVEDVLTEHFSTPVLQDLHARRQKGKLHQSPNTLISLYNSVLDHVALAVTSSALGDISWPAPELVTDTALHDGLPPSDWNSKTHLADIYQLLTTLRLPWFHYEDRSAMDWSHACRDVWKFVSDVCSSHSPSVTLTTRVSRLLARTCVNFEKLCRRMKSEDYCVPLYVNAPWADIVLACVNFRIENLYWKKEDDADADVQVFYDEKDMAEFEPPAAWVHAVLDTEDAEVCMEETVEQAAAAGDNEDTTADGNMSFNSCLSEDGYQTQDELKMEDERWKGIDSLQLGHCENFRVAFDLSNRLLTQMEEEKHKTHEFEHYLEEVMREETEDRSMTAASGSSAQQILTVSAAILATDFAHSPATAAVPSVSSRSHAGQAARPDHGLADQMSLVESIERLKETISAQSRANELFERHLQMILDT